MLKGSLFDLELKGHHLFSLLGDILSFQINYAMNRFLIPSSRIRCFSE